MSVANAGKLSGELLGRFDDAQPQNRRYFHFDGLGSTVDVTDGSGGVTGSYAYGAWGSLAGTTGATVYPYLYVGQLGYYTHTSDQGTEVQSWLNLGVRFYDPEIGRFERRDPLEDELRHAYAYAALSPGSLVDPSGLATVCQQVFFAPTWRSSRTTRGPARKFRPDMIAAHTLGANFVTDIECTRIMFWERLETTRVTISYQTVEVCYDGCHWWSNSYKFSKVTTSNRWKRYNTTRTKFDQVFFDGEVDYGNLKKYCERLTR